MLLLGLIGGLIVVVLWLLGVYCWLIMDFVFILVVEVEDFKVFLSWEI